MPENHTSNGRLDSWKDIAAYLGRDVRTVIRWEENGLPVHRVPGGKRQAVFAYRSEIDDWLLGKAPGGILVTPATQHPDSPAEPRKPPPDSNGQKGSSRFLKRAVLTAGLLTLLLSAVAGVVSFSATRGPVRITNITRLSRDGRLKTGLVTDGARVYFAEYVEGKLQLSSISVDGGPIDHIATPFPKALVEDIAADGSELLVRGREGTEDETGLWIVPVSGRPARRVGSIVCHAAAWSRDGKVIAYSRGNHLFLTFDEGTTSREIHEFEFEPYSLRWSHAGSRLTFMRHTKTADFVPWQIEFGDHYEVRSVSAVPFAPENCCSGWTDSLGYEFFVSRTRENGIWTLAPGRLWRRPATTQSVDLTTSLGGLSSLVADAQTQRLFVVATEPNRAEFLRFEPFSRTFSPFLPGVSGLYLDFSRDGQWIAYSAFSDFTLWASRSDGTERRQLISSFDEVELPRWSPDGTHIAFTAKKAGRPWRIYVVSREGGSLKEASSGVDNQGAPTWSLDGKWLAYANVACQEDRSCAVHRIELATGRVETLPGSEGMRTARWSPDGRYIATLRPDRHELMVFDVQKDRWSKLADSIRGDDLSWSQDSRYLYSNRPVGDNPSIVRIPISGGQPESIVDLQALSRMSGKFDTGLCVAPDNSVILSRQINSSEIYALDWSAR